MSGDLSLIRTYDFAALCFQGKKTSLLCRLPSALVKVKLFFFIHMYKYNTMHYIEIDMFFTTCLLYIYLLNIKF